MCLLFGEHTALGCSASATLCWFIYRSRPVRLFNEMHASLSKSDPKMLSQVGKICCCIPCARHPFHLTSRSEVTVWYLEKSHYSDVIMSAIASQVTGVSIVCSTLGSGADRWKKSKLRVTGLCEGNSPVTGEFPTQKTSKAGNVFIWWRHQNFNVADWDVHQLRIKWWR